MSYQCQQVRLSVPVSIWPFGGWFTSKYKQAMVVCIRELQMLNL